MNKESIENYALSLVKHGLYSTIDKARKESIRWHNKKDKGLVEPLQCPHRPDMENSLFQIEYKIK